VTSDDKLSHLSEPELVAAYVQAVQRRQKIEHVGATNRLFDWIMRIRNVLNDRSGGTLAPLYILLDHNDPQVRYCVAHALSTVSPDAFERTLRALAERDDEVGREAQSSLRHQAYLKTMAPNTVGAIPQRHVWERHWQSENPPPPSMPLADIERAIAAALPGNRATALLRLARPAIGLWPQRPADDLPISASRFGGMPHAPPDWIWPVRATEPLLFLGHINCAQLEGIPGAEQLPSSGLLAFFGDHDLVMGCLGTSQGGAVYYWPDVDRLAPATAPIAPLMVFPLALLTFRPLIDLPDPNSEVARRILPNREDVERYSKVHQSIRLHGLPEEVAWYCGFSKLLGWPTLVQDDLDLRTTGPNAYRLLLQIDQYTNGTESEGWGPGGSIYCGIRDKDLRERKFERCDFDMQCT